MAAEPLGKRLSAVCPPALARLLPTGPQPKRVQPPSARPDGRALCAGTAVRADVGATDEQPPAAGRGALSGGSVLLLHGCESVARGRGLERRADLDSDQLVL